MATPIHIPQVTLDVQQSLSSTEKQQSADKIEQMDANPNSSLSIVKHFELSLKPREYQLELAEPGLEGKNYIVVAPTNSGKTLVAAIVIAHHLEKNSGQKTPPKVVVAVKTRPLADQRTNN